MVRGMTRCVDVCVLTACLAGCYVTAGVGYPAEFIDTHNPARIWVTETNGSVITVDNPQMHRDTLAGFVAGAFRELPIDSVKFVRARLLDAGRTAILVGAGALGAAAVVVSLTGGKGNANTCFNGLDQQVPCPTT
jgi:hypothetical protein